MDALTELNIIGLGVSGVLLAMACVKADRVRAWRAGINPSAPEVSDASFTVARVALGAMAGVGIWTCVQGFGVADDMAWSDGELTSAVRGATDDLDGYTYRTDQSGTPLYFDDYETLIRDKVTENGGGDAPSTGVTAEPAPANTDADAYFTVAANGTETSFCTHVVRARSKKDDYTPPGITGGEGTVTFPGYRLAVGTREGAC
ncbi:hypothetical protein [Streptomyces sp. NPDC050528]|uniref:hypothetical protein n=1 Tax=Streptomyces sp. NPDC050528 TaxID=3365623 RepID=UPI00379E8220